MFTGGKIAAIHRERNRLRLLSDDRLRECSLELRNQVRSGTPVRKLIPQSFGLVDEALSRRCGLRYYDVQFAAGIALCGRRIVEMQTGEGKTITAALPLFLNALAGRGANLATANDYLARRDAEWLRPVYGLLGLSIGAITSDMQDEERRKSYRCDLTYGTLQEFGFDFLRDHLAGTPSQFSSFVRPHAHASRIADRMDYLLIDEADSLLIDEARTPLVLSLPTHDSPLNGRDCVVWAGETANSLLGERDFEWAGTPPRCELKPRTKAMLRQAPVPPSLEMLTQTELEQAVRRALEAQFLYHCGEHYLLRDGEVVLIDEPTGRTAPGKQLRNGYHQAVEFKEGLDISPVTEPAARTTVRELVASFRNVSGMTGTAREARAEFRKDYGLRFRAVPTHRPECRTMLPPLVFPTRDEKHAAVVRETRTMLDRGRPVLIGTRTITLSQELSRCLLQDGVEHQVLNGIQDEDEAVVVSRAGQPGQVTIATNMAGRGTDIKLGPGVADAGGLHVLATELHSSARIDRQLIGRCGRQGDPGSCRQMMSFDDDLVIRVYGPELVERMKASARTSRSERPGLFLFRRAQKIETARQRKERKLLNAVESRRMERNESMGRDYFLEALD